MLTSLQNVQKLTIQGVIILQILSLAELFGTPFPQLKTKELTVEIMVVQTVMFGIKQLLQNSSGLKKITVHTMNCEIIEDEKLDYYFKRKDLNLYDCCWCGFFPTVENDIVEDANSKHVASFVELLLQNSDILETMVLHLGGYLNAIEYRKLLTTVPKMSWKKNGEVKAISRVMSQGYSMKCNVFVSDIVREV